VSEHLIDRLPIAEVSVVLKTDIIDGILLWAKTKADQQIKKTDGSKRNRFVFA